MGRRLQDGAIAVTALALAAVVVLTVDKEVRGYVTDVATRITAPGGVTTAAVQGQSALNQFTKTVTDSGMEHAPLVVFGLAAAALFVFMLRT